MKNKETSTYIKSLKKQSLFYMATAGISYTTSVLYLLQTLMSIHEHNLETAADKGLLTLCMLAFGIMYNKDYNSTKHQLNNYKNMQKQR